MMVQLMEIARRAAARVQRTLRDDPLLRPLEQASDDAIDEALSARGLERADLFTGGTSLAPHRHRIAAMLAVQNLSPRTIVWDHWPALKAADRRCASCPSTRRCESWLLWGRRNDAPKVFCPNAATFDRIKSSLTRTADRTGR